MAGTWATGSFDGEGVVDLTDFNTVVNNFGLNARTAVALDAATYASGLATVTAPVPEPGAAFALLGLGGLALRRRAA